MYNNEGYEGIKWTPEFLFTYAPRTFETAAVNGYSARMALEQAISCNFFRHIPA